MDYRKDELKHLPQIRLHKILEKKGFNKHEMPYCHALSLLALSEASNGQMTKFNNDIKGIIKDLNAGDIVTIPQELLDKLNKIKPLQNSDTQEALQNQHQNPDHIKKVLASNLSDMGCITGFMMIPDLTDLLDNLAMTLGKHEDAFLYVCSGDHAVALVYDATSTSYFLCDPNKMPFIPYFQIKNFSNLAKALFDAFTLPENKSVTKINIGIKYYSGTDIKEKRTRLNKFVHENMPSKYIMETDDLNFSLLTLIKAVRDINAFTYLLANYTPPTDQSAEKVINYYAYLIETFYTLFDETTLKIYEMYEVKSSLTKTIKQLPTQFKEDVILGACQNLSVKDIKNLWSITYEMHVPSLNQFEKIFLSYPFNLSHELLNLFFQNKPKKIMLAETEALKFNIQHKDPRLSASDKVKLTEILETFIKEFKKTEKDDSSTLPDINPFFLPLSNLKLAPKNSSEPSNPNPKPK
jgi:hypothetical protein